MPYKITTLGAATLERDDTIVNRFMDALLQPWQSTYQAFSSREAKYIAVTYLLLGMAGGSMWARKNVANGTDPLLGYFG